MLSRYVILFVSRASWQYTTGGSDYDQSRWLITTTQGQLTANVLILGNGPLSEPSLPAIPGIEQFAGTLFHSARWRHDYDLTGKRVAVIGTGVSSMHRQVADPELRAKLTPHYAMGCKRILLSDDFYPALTQPNVELVTERIREVRAGSIVTEDGQEHEVDTIICGTGFHVTDTAFAGCVYGRNGQSLADRWGDALDAYLGTAVSGFPNLFLLIGPNTGLGHSSMVFMIEAHVAYILDCLRTMERRNWQTVEIKPEVQEAFNAEVQQRMQGTIWNSGCKSWYIASSGRNTTLWPGFTFDFRRRTRHFDRQSYQTS